MISGYNYLRISINKSSLSEMSKKKKLPEPNPEQKSFDELKQMLKNPSDDPIDLRSCMGCFRWLFKWALILVLSVTLVNFIKEKIHENKAKKISNPDNSYDDDSRQPDMNTSSPGIPTFRSDRNNNTFDANEKPLLNPTSDNDTVINPDSLRKWRNQQKEIEELKKELQKQKQKNMSREEIEDYIDQEIENRLDH